MMKTLNTLGLEDNFLNLIKDNSKNGQPTSHFVVKDRMRSWPEIKKKKRMAAPITSSQHHIGGSSQGTWVGKRN